MMTLCLILCFCGFSALSLGTGLHAKKAFNASLASIKNTFLQLFGWLLLGVAITPAVHVLGLSMGLASWVAMLSIGALAVMLLLTYKPHLLTWLAEAGLPAALLLLTQIANKPNLRMLPAA